MNAYEIARAEATRVVEAAYRKAVAAGELPEGTIPPVAVETPKDSSNGDWASTFAMQCAKPLHMAPRKIAESIVANLDLEGSCFDTVTIAGPGFMNFTLNQGWYEQAVRGVFAMGENYGRTESKKPEKVMVEFVSANPTGPMHMGNARGGVLGDCLSSVLDWSGNDVTREFYINDAGNQVDKFAHSVEGRYIQEIRGEDAIEAAKGEIGSYLTGTVHIPPGRFDIISQDEMLRAGNEIDGTMTLLLAGIAGISLVVAGIGVMNVMLVSVTERTREIGIKKALGARRFDILVQFLLEALVLSIIGGVLGIAAGIALGLLMGTVGLAFVVSWGVVAVAVAAATAIGLVFGIFPAYRASRKNPIEALRTE